MAKRAIDEAIVTKQIQVSEQHIVVRGLTLSLSNAANALAVEQKLSHHRRLTKLIDGSLTDIRKANVKLRILHTQLDQLLEKKANGIVRI